MTNPTTNDQPAELLARWRNGDQQAAAELFRRYVDRLIALVRSRLSSQLAQRIDPEDVVQSVYRSFFADTREGRYDPQRGGDLWQVLVTLTLHKLTDQAKRHGAEKRAVRREQTFGSEDSLLGLQARLAGHEPSPLEAAALAEMVEQLMRRLDARHRRMLEMRLQGHNLEEIARAVECSQRTVIRFFEQVKKWLETGADGNRAG